MKQLLFGAIVLVGTILGSMKTLSAALSTDFHNAPLATVKASTPDFHGRSLGARTASQYNSPDGQNIFVAADFDTASAQNVLVLGENRAKFEQDVAYMATLRLAPRELSIFQATVSEDAIYGGIWSSTPFATAFVHTQNDQQFAASFQEWVVQKGYRVADYALWADKGLNRHAAVFIKDSQQFAFFYNVNEATFKQKNIEMRAKGMFLDKVNITQMPTGFAYSGVWLPQSRQAQFVYKMDSVGFKNKFEELKAQGYTLKQVHGYGSLGNLFAGIWVK